MEWSEEFKSQSAMRLQENVPRIAKCLVQLTNQEVWFSPNEQSNSIGHLILHLCGNITQYIQSALGGAMDNRQRQLEFNSEDHLSNKELVAKITKVINEAELIILNAEPENLLLTRQVQAFSLSGIGIIIHVVEHLSYHTGQIAFYTKQLKNKDLEFYKGLNLD